MGEIIDIHRELLIENPNARKIDVDVFARALTIYHEASVNIAENGAVCAHPKTGQPIENPYLKVQAQQAGILAKMRHIASDRIVMMLSARAS